MKYFYLYSLCCILLLSACREENPTSENVFLGGQINNPETDYVILSKENKNLDTLYLNEKNQFGKDYKNLESGIYTFKHPPENQIMFIEPGDSIVIWLNTMAFDESLNFSGNGAEKSNFLLDMFLKNQDDNDLILTYYKIEPEKFAKITDSIKTERIKKLERLDDNNNFSEGFLEIARASIDYEYFDLRERYTYLIRKYYNEMAQKIPDDFHDYRKKIDFNDEDLQDYYVYTNLIDDYLRSRAIEYCIEKHNDHKNCYKLNSFENLKSRIVLMDSLSDLQPLKNEFIDRLASQMIITAESASRIDSILNLLEDIDYAGIKDLENLAEVQTNYFVGNSVENIATINTDKELVSYGEFIERPTVLFAWSITVPARHRWQHNIVNNLRNKYPELDFVGINVDLNNYEEWLRTIETYGYDKSKEYQITQKEADKETYLNYLNKVLLISPDGIVLKGDLNFGSQDFEQELLEYLNKKDR